MKLIFSEVNDKDTGKKEAPALHKRIVARVGGLSLFDFRIEKMLEEPDKLTEFFDALRKDPRVTELQRFDSHSIQDFYSLLDDGKSVGTDSVDILDRKPVQFVVTLEKTDMRLTEQFSNKFFESIDHSVKFVVIVDSFFVMYFSELGEINEEANLFLDVRDKLEKILKPFNPKSLPPNLADVRIIVDYNDDEILAFLSNGEGKIELKSYKDSDIGKVAQRLYNTLKFILGGTYTLAQEVSKAHEYLGNITDLNSRLLTTYKKVLETSRLKITAINKHSKALSFEISELMENINDFFDAKNTIENWSYSEIEQNDVEKLLLPVKKQVLSLFEEDVQPEFRILELIITQITGYMQLLKSYYVIALSALIGAVVGAITSRII